VALNFRAVYPIAHNISMPLKDCCLSRRVRRVLLLIVCFLTVQTFSFALPARTQPETVYDSAYASALSAADRLLQAWQSGDAESGMPLLTTHAKQTAGTDIVESFFSRRESAAYEITRGKMLKRGRYEFPVLLLIGSSKNLRRRFSSMVVINTGHNDWAIDKLP
jgi:hypothetical protein